MGAGQSGRWTVGPTLETRYRSIAIVNISYRAETMSTVTETSCPIIELLAITASIEPWHRRSLLYPMPEAQQDKKPMNGNARGMQMAVHRS